MPSASAKLEKQASFEASDPIKQVVVMMDKKVRNLEKRKGKLDNYKTEHQNGKELNEDQMIAMKKYDHVVEVLEFAKELQKSFGTVIQEALKHQKKAAKKELIEKQQQEIQRVKEILLFRDITNAIVPGEIRQDFLLGRNGAVHLSNSDFELLDKLLNLVSPHHENDNNYSDKLSMAAENLISIAEGKNKECLGTTYKSIRTLLLKIHECGYFASSKLEVEDEADDDEAVSSEDAPEIEEDINQEESKSTLCQINGSVDIYPESQPEVLNSSEVKPESSEVENEISPETNENLCESETFYSANDACETSPTFTTQNCPLPKVQGHFNFLQESQIDLESPHMDPAVIAAHPMAPANYKNNQFEVQPAHHELNQVNGEKESLSGTIVVAQSATVTHEDPEQLNPVQHVEVSEGIGQDFDPNQLIPTQTFTNQNFAMIQNMIPTAVVPTTYIPVTMTHGALPTHVTQMAVMPHAIAATGAMPPSSVATTLPVHLAHCAAIPVTTSGDLPSQSALTESKESYKGSTEKSSNEIDIVQHPQCDSSINHMEIHGKQTEPINFQFRNGSNRGNRNRGRGTSNGYMRGRGNFGNNRGNYQSSYSGNAGYNGNSYRSRGGSRGGPRGSGNGRGARGGSYRIQYSQQQRQERNSSNNDN